MNDPMKQMLDVAPERHVHVKGNTIYTTSHPAGTADSLRHDYMVARKAWELRCRARSEAIDGRLVAGVR
jgi:hypothetical protein